MTGTLTAIVKSFIRKVRECTARLKDWHAGLRRTRICSIESTAIGNVIGTGKSAN